MPMSMATMGVMGALGISPQAATFIRTKIRELVRREGVSPRRAAKMAFRAARAAGYKVPLLGELRGVLAATRRVVRTWAAMTPAAKRFVQEKIRILIRDEGYPRDQAVAIAFRMAKAAGFAVPEAPVRVRIVRPRRRRR